MYSAVLIHLPFRAFLIAVRLFGMSVGWVNPCTRVQHQLDKAGDTQCSFCVVGHDPGEENSVSEGYLKVRLVKWATSAPQKAGPFERVFQRCHRVSYCGYLLIVEGCQGSARASLSPFPAAQQLLGSSRHHHSLGNRVLLHYRNRFPSYRRKRLGHVARTGLWEVDFGEIAC